MPVQQIPPRLIWAVELMDPQPGDNVLEIGCGPGYGAELICQRLTTGKLFAIDRSESGVDRGHELRVGGRLDGTADLRADLPAGAQHADPDLCPDLCLVSCAHAVNRIGPCVSVCGGG